ncbi:MAG: glycosyl hydrolase family 18 protein [Clostridium paraputrificum]
MAKRKLKKNLKTFVAFSAITALLLTNGIPISALTQSSNTTEITSQATTGLRNVMYYGDWSIWGGQGNFYPKDIPADKLTHLNFAFMDFNASGELIYCDKDAAIGHPLGNAGVTYGDVNGGILNAFQVLRAENPNLKIGVSLGGWSKSGDFSTMAANASTRAKFVENVMKFIKYTNMDFVDLDWEYPGEYREPDKTDNTNDEGTPNASPQDKDNYILLLQDLKNALNKQGKELGKTYELSVALPAGVSKIEAGIDVDKLFDIVDFANIMTYDMAGAWSTTSGHQTALYANPNAPEEYKGLSVNECVNYYISQGAERQKIVIGAAYYTRGWEQVSDKGVDPNNPGLFGEAAVVNKNADLTPTPGALNESPLKNGEGGRAGGVWGYNALDKLKAKYTGLKEYWDDSAKAPYLYNPETGAFFTYDNVRSIQEKAKYVKENNLGGMIAWMASQDATTTSTKRDELTNATKEALFGSGELPKYDVKYTNPNLTCTVTPVTQAWGTGGVLNVSIKNNEKLSESGEVLSTVETAAKTVKNMKVYIKTNGVAITGSQYPAGPVSKVGDYYVIDFGGMSDGKLMKPGTEFTFDLNLDKAIEDTSSIISVEVSQRMYQTSPEIMKQTIWGDTNSAPVISGANNITINLGDKFNALSGVTATDKEDGDLTSAIKVAGTVDTLKAGEYTLTYSVKDSSGKETIVTRVVTVFDKDAPVVNTNPEITGVKDQTIKLGSTFNPLSGVKATDKEDGDLTNAIKVAGTVDTSKTGVYKLTYTVVDKDGGKAEVSCNITVEDQKYPTYDSKTVYNGGDIVVYNGETYRCKWWTQGEIPGSSEWGAWEKIS